MRTLGLSLVGFALVACAATSDPLCANDVCTAAADGGGIASGPDECAADPTSAACTTEDVAIFVKAGAPSVGADGSKAKPYATINDGITHTTTARRRVYVCTGSYQSPVVVKSGASVFGGLDCDWNKGGAHPTIVNNQGPAVTIKDAQFVVFADISISANAASSVPGDSAIGMFISSSSNVIVQRVDIVTGNGIAAKPSAATLPNYTAATATSGGNSGKPSGGPGASCKCQDGTTSVGGNGGTFGAAEPAGAGQPGTAMPSVGIPNGAGTLGCEGGPGADGPRPEKIVTTSVLGSITKDGWVPTTTAAAAGNSGHPGQGGGGAAPVNPNGGSGGGCGGCGGTGGVGGQPGGSSFGIVLFQSTTVAIQDTTIKTGNGADGGEGAAGQNGQVGGDGGQPAAATTCIGAKGGYGSGGGGGTGGHGGHSIGVAYVGTIPFITGGTTTTSAAGKGGKAGAGGAANGTINNGLDGDVGLPGTKGDNVQLN